jgi:ParB family chromosome partitioning protein
VAKRALGKGLDALIPQAVIESISAERIIQIPLDQIRANPYQPRKQFDREKLESLADSIRVDGVLQPVVVRKTSEGYELVMGERRFQAARIAGVNTVPAILKEVANVDALRLALVENLQRENLNALEVANAYKTLIDSFGLSASELAEFVAKDRSTVSNTLRLLGLPDEVKDMMRDGSLSEGHARAVLAAATKEEQIALAQSIVSDRLNVRQAEAHAGIGKSSKEKVAREKKKPAHIVFLENAFSKHLGTRVSIDEKRGGKGKIAIEFYSHEEFERLAETMQIPLPR